jgi:hypothetical protein
MSTDLIRSAPLSGRAFPQYDDASVARASAALEVFGEIDIAYGPQDAIAGRIDVLRRRCLGKRGVPLPGLRLSQVSQAGKTRAFERYRRKLATGSALSSGTPNPWQVLYLGLEVRISVKMMCQQLLRLLGDPHASQGNTDEVKLRVQEMMIYRNVELLIIDEAQHLARESQDKVDVTDEIKRFLDMGIVPVVLAGNEDSRRFFERNQQLASRLGSPVELSPVDAGEVAQLRAFAEFCAELDDQMVASGIVPKPSDLGASAQVDGLLKASGGHVGRVCRLIESALEHSVLRGADRIELYDLRYAVETFAIPQEYVRSNPFA